MALVYNDSACGAGIVFLQILYQATPADCLQKKSQFRWSKEHKGTLLTFQHVQTLHYLQNGFADINTESVWTAQCID